MKKRLDLLHVLPFVLVALAFLCNHWFLGILISADGEFSTRNKWIVWLFQLSALAAGAWIWFKASKGNDGIARLARTKG